jgi:tetratricopeptide (TPR) repeat protein
MVEDFIGRFPKAADGYYYRALQAYQHDDFAAVQKDMELAIGVTDQKDASHYNYSRFVYDKVVMKPKATYEPWTLDLALNEAAEAYRINPQPAYLQHQAHVLYAQQRYADASDLYTQLAQTPLRSAELFYEASRCRMMMGDTLGQVALLDSAVAMFSRPYVRAAAPYLLGRSQVLQGMEKYREAIVDMNDYEELMKNQLNDNFYYMRFQTALKGRLFQMALDDINKALALRPDHEVYLSEKASLLVRVGMLDEALSTAEQLIKVAPEQSDGYLFAGLARCLKGEKEKGIELLKKALELGDAQAEALISKYQ